LNLAKFKMSDFEQLPFEKLHLVIRVFDQGGIRPHAPDTHGKLILASKTIGIVI